MNCVSVSRKPAENSEYSNVFNVPKGRVEASLRAIADAGSGVKLSMVDIPENQRRAGMGGRAGTRTTDPNGQIASVTAAIAVAIDTAARLTGIADQGTSHATNGGTHCRTAYIAGRHPADDGAGRSTDAGALFRLCASGERKDEHSCEEDVLHDWFLF
jgi:hypothetical protein